MIRLLLCFLIFCAFKAQSQDEIIYDIKKLNAEINSASYDEMSPVLSTDATTLFFTRVGSPDFNKTLGGEENSRRTLRSSELRTSLGGIYSEIAGRVVTDPVRSSFNQDIFYSSGNVESGWANVSHPPYPLNSALPNSVMARTSTPSQYILLNQYDVDGGMNRGFSLVKQRADGSFDFPKPMHIRDFHTASEEISLCMSPDGNSIILALDRPEGYGDLDLYISFKINDYDWSVPSNLGPMINTEHREIAPYLSEENGRLFYATNREDGEDLDIYFTSRQNRSWKQWTVPQRLPDPINGDYDDTQPCLLEGSNQLFFVSNRDNQSDIYQVDLKPIVLKEKNLKIKGKVVNGETGRPFRALVLWGKAEEEEYEDFFNTFTGKFNINLTFKRDYRFTAEKIGWITDDLILDPDMFTEADSLFELTIEMFPLKKQSTIKLNDILFARTEARILPSSLPELNRLLRILQKNDKVCMRIEGHTDNVGDGNALMQLSENRAKAIKSYLVQKGIEPARILTKGYGDSVPLNKNLTEEDKRLNRRVEIRFLRNCP